MSRSFKLKEVLQNISIVPQGDFTVGRLVYFSSRWHAAFIAGIFFLALYGSFADWLAQLGSSLPAETATPTAEATEADLVTATHTPALVAGTTSTETVRPTEATPTLELTLTPTLTPSPSPSPSPPVYTGIFLELVFTDTSWIQVTVDGVREFQGELEEGTYRSWYGEERIELRVGNAIVAYQTYLAKTLWPADLVFIYPYRAPTGAAVLLAAALLLAFSAAALGLRHRAPWFLFGWCWFLNESLNTHIVIKVSYTILRRVFHFN